METDPITGAPYPPDTIQRILHIAPKAHIYAIPPIYGSGFNAASWTADPRSHIFTARIRIVETCLPAAAAAAAAADATSEQGKRETVVVNILLEDPKDGALFAAAPYASAAAVEQANDSSRFFAIRVVGDAGKRKATLGLGFEDRTEAFDFGVVLQDVRRGLGWEANAAGQRGSGAKKGGANRAGGGSGGGGGGAAAAAAATPAEENKRDLSLKEGEMITIQIGGKGRRGIRQAQPEQTGGTPFTIAPPPGTKASSSAFSLLPPPPPPASSSSSAWPETSHEASQPSQPSAEDLGFDDGEFGEFQ